MTGRLPKREREVWRVEIPRHVIRRESISGGSLAGEYVVPASVEIQHERSKRSAILVAVLNVHTRHGIPEWLPYARQTARCAVVSREVISVGP